MPSTFYECENMGGMGDIQANTDDRPIKEGPLRTAQGQDCSTKSKKTSDPGG